MAPTTARNASSIDEASATAAAFNFPNCSIWARRIPQKQLRAAISKALACHVVTQGATRTPQVLGTPGCLQVHGQLFHAKVQADTSSKDMRGKCCGKPESMSCRNTFWEPRSVETSRPGLARTQEESKWCSP